MPNRKYNANGGQARSKMFPIRTHSKGRAKAIVTLGQDVVEKAERDLPGIEWTDDSILTISRVLKSTKS